jgi:mono/diheme cytochrome c family protein
MNYKYMLPVMIVLAATFVSSKAAPQTSSAPQAKAQGATHAGKKQTPASQGAVHQDEGQRVFDQNCSRCHTAPDGFSSRISGTVVRHMRVRASLSQHDEQELLRFLNP